MLNLRIVMLKYFLVCCLLVTSFVGFSQKMEIRVQVYDSIAEIPVRDAVGMVIRVKDSVLLDFKRSDKFGNMNFSLPIDTVQLVVRHPNYGDFTSYFFGSTENSVFELMPLVMSEKSTGIEEVVIFANKNPIYYRGDTLVYIADSFKVKENAVVEDLIRKLPGMTIDANGKISNQGKEINQVLVDGDEFFGSDATIATKNLAAKGVEEVKVYEKDAEDGSDEKLQVLDLKLKDEAKKGYFGKVNLAGGVNQFTTPNTGFYEGEVLLNKYNSKQKIAVFGLASNTPKTDFNGRDMFKFGLSEGMNWGNESDDIQSFEGNSVGGSEGIPQTIRAGFYLDQKLWKGGKVRVNYAFSQYGVTSQQTSLSQYILSDTTYYTDRKSVKKENYLQHQIGVKFTQQLDSLTKLEFEPKFNFNKNMVETNSLTYFESSLRDSTRYTDQTDSTGADGFSTNSTLRLIKDFKKKNRKLIMRYNLSTNDNSSDGFLNTVDRTVPTLDTNYLFDQKKENRYVSLANTGYINYVEPFAKKWRAEFDYEFYSNNNEQRKTAFSPMNGSYTNIDSLFSNEFSANRQQHRLGAFLIFENAKTRISAGTRARTISIDNNNVFLDTTIKQGLNNLLPRVVITHKFSSSNRLRLTYNTNSSLPSVDQLQPVIDNSNPNFRRVGNPDLRPNYTHTLNLSHNMWKGLSGFYVYSGINYTHQNDAFSTSTIYLQNGQTESRAINVRNADFLFYYGGMGIPLNKVMKDLRLDVNLNGNFTATENYINNLQNISKNNGIGTDLTLRYNGDSLNFDLGAGFDYNAPNNTLATLTNQPYTVYNFRAAIDWTLPYRWFVKTDATYNKNTGLTSGYNVNYVIWNASVQRSFLKTGNLYLGIEAYDILNQNISNFREVNNNVIVDQRINVIRRYFMLKMTLKFNNNRTREVEDDHWF